MERLPAGRLKGSAVDPGSEQIQVEPRRFAAPQRHDIADGQHGRDRGQEELREKRQAVVAVQQHGQDEDGYHSGNDHRHPEIALKSKGVSRRPRSRPGIRIDQGFAHLEN